MKKILFVAALAVGLFACSSAPDVNDPKEYCWEMKISATVNGVSADDVTYFWGTGAAVQDNIDFVKQQHSQYFPGTDVEVKATKTNKTEAQCDEEMFGDL